MKLAVIIPVYNEEKYIYKALNSLLNQIRKPDMIVICDNNSTDDTLAILYSYEEIFKLIGIDYKIVSESKKGSICFPMQRAYKQIPDDFDIVGKIDADTIIPYDYYEKIEKEMLNSNFAQISTSEQLPNRTLVQAIYQNTAQLLVMILSKLNPYDTRIFCGNGITYRNKFLNEVNGWDLTEEELIANPKYKHDDLYVSEKFKTKHLKSGYIWTIKHLHYDHNLILKGVLETAKIHIFDNAGTEHSNRHDNS